MSDFTFIKDQASTICGVWLRNSADAYNDAYIVTLFLQGGLSPEEIAGTFRVVPNYVDKKGGVFVMLGSAQAPCEGKDAAKEIKYEQGVPQNQAQSDKATIHESEYKGQSEVRKLIYQYSTRIKPSHIFLWPNIPSKQLRNALKSYAKGIQEGEVLAIFDNTTWGSGKYGLLLAETHGFLLLYASSSSSSQTQVCDLASVTGAGFTLGMPRGEVEFMDLNALIKEKTSNSIYLNGVMFLDRYGSSESSANDLFIEMLNNICKSFHKVQ